MTHDYANERVSVSGPTVLEGVGAVEFEATGPTRVEGDVTAATSELSGETSVEGATTVETLAASGALALGDVSADALEATGDLRADAIETGTVRVEGSIRAAEIVADAVELVLHGESAVERIQADDVSVVRDNPDGRLVADRIEADSASLDAVEATEVVADEVALGPDAAVETVTADEIDAHGDATVGTRRPR